MRSPAAQPERPVPRPVTVANGHIPLAPLLLPAVTHALGATRVLGWPEQVRLALTCRAAAAVHGAAAMDALGGLLTALHADPAPERRLDAIAAQLPPPSPSPQTPDRLQTLVGEVHRTVADLHLLRERVVRGLPHVLASVLPSLENRPPWAQRLVLRQIVFGLPLDARWRENVNGENQRQIHVEYGRAMSLLLDAVNALHDPLPGSLAGLMSHAVHALARQPVLDRPTLLASMTSLMAWPTQAVRRAFHALAAGATPVRPDDLHWIDTLWNTFALSEGGEGTRPARERLWSMFLEGPVVPPRWMQPPLPLSHYRGPMGVALREGRSADHICRLFHVDDAAMRRWIQEAAARFPALNDTPLRHPPLPGYAASGSSVEPARAGVRETEASAASDGMAG